MSFHGADLLQFDELKDLIASFAGSVAGKQRILSCGTSGSREAAEADLRKPARRSPICATPWNRSERHKESQYACASINCVTWKEFLAAAG